MTAPQPAPPPDPRVKAVEYLWRQFNVWDETSEAHRRSLAFWRPLVLLMGVAGGVLGALSAEGAVRPSWVEAWPHWGALGLPGGILLALAAFLTRELLSPESESRWVRARAAAEAFKREAFLMAASAPPHDGAVGAAWFDRAKDILATTGELEEAPVAAKRVAKWKAPPRSPMSVGDYVEQRVEDQWAYYRNAVGRYVRAIRRVKAATVALGLSAAVLSYMGGAYGAWVAVVTSATTSLAAYLYARRLQYLVVSYSATARQLEALRVAWETSGRTDAETAERNQFISATEAILASQNMAWMADWSKKNAVNAANTQGGGGASPP